MRELNDIRLDINNVDDKLKTLFLERMEYVKQVLEYKKSTGTPVKNKNREADILEKKLLGIENFRTQTRDFFKSLIEISCDYQYKSMSEKVCFDKFKHIDDDSFFKNIKTVCYQGIKGSYSYETARKYFGNKKLLCVSSFEEVFENVKDSKCDIGILPIENLSMGCVQDVYDLLYNNDVYITNMTELPINHCIAGVSDFDSIKTVISHPQALGQCREFIDENKFKTVSYQNTAVAAKYVSDVKDKSLAAICSIDCAKTYGLNILNDSISNIKNNRTKFIFISKKPVILNNSDKISILFTVKHESGTLARVLNDFAKNDINMTKIESRPSHTDEWKYIFYVDLDVPDFDFFEYFSGISYMFEDFKILGVYKTLR